MEFDEFSGSDLMWLTGYIDRHNAENSTDESIIKELQSIFEPKSWFAVFRIAELMIYGGAENK